MDARLVENARRTHKEVEAAVREAGLSVRLLLGFEMEMIVAATTDVDTLRSLCIQGDGVPGKALLVEMPFTGWPPFVEETLYRLSIAGMVPVIAHPERNERVRRSPDALRACMDAGAVLQGTSGSLSSLFRKDSAKTFYELLARGWFALLASDAHHQPDYTWSLAPLLADLGGRLSPEERDLLVNINPGLILQGRRPIPASPKRSGRRRFLA
jgi:protein-tyrosine phosphatase